MTVSLSYDFSLFGFEECSHVNIFQDKSTFEFTENMYVFTIIFIFYLMYSHDFSYVSRHIKFHKHTQDGQLIEIPSSLMHLPNSELQ
jgi:hypothetical protein